MSWRALIVPFAADSAHLGMHSRVQDQELERAAEQACGRRVYFEGFVCDGRRVVTRFSSGQQPVYAWAVDGDYVAVLGEPRIDSLMAAVRASHD